MPYELDVEDDPMRYRFADDVDLLSLCDQPLRLQRIFDHRGNVIILAIGEDHTAVTLAYGVKPKVRKPEPSIQT